MNKSGCMIQPQLCRFLAPLTILAVYLSQESRPFQLGLDQPLVKLCDIISIITKKDYFGPLLTNPLKNFQRWSTKDWKGGVFEMFPEYAHHSWQFWSLVPRGSPLLISPELENCQYGCTCLIAHGVNPTFHHHSDKSHHQLTRFVSVWIVYIFVQYIIATKMWQNGAVVGQVPHFGPFGKNQQKRCQKEQKNKFHRIRFLACQAISAHKRSTPVVFWGEKRPWVDCGGSIRKHSVPKFELDFCPDRERDRK